MHLPSNLKGYNCYTGLLRDLCDDHQVFIFVSSLYSLQLHTTISGTAAELKHGQEEFLSTAPSVPLSTKMFCIFFCIFDASSKKNLTFNDLNEPESFMLICVRNVSTASHLTEKMN